MLQTKRGTHLITAIDRLTLLAGEFQRIGISATVKPMDLVAEFIGGYRRAGSGYEPRRVTPLAAPSDKKVSLSVQFPTPPAEPGVRSGDSASLNTVCPSWWNSDPSQSSTDWQFDPIAALEMDKEQARIVLG